MDEILAAKGETRPDAPEGPYLGPEFGKSAKVVYPDGPKRQLTMRLDTDVVACVLPGYVLHDLISIG